MNTVEPLYKTKTELAMDAIRRLVRSGDLSAGGRLDVGELSRRLGMSQTPIREAMRMLQAEGLLTRQAYARTSIRHLSDRDRQELYALRAFLESFVVKLAVEKMTDEEWRQLEEIHRSMEEAYRQNRPSDLIDVNRRWHLFLADIAKTAFAGDMMRRLLDAVSWHEVFLVPSNVKTSLHQHRAVMKAIGARDAALASRLMREHVISGQHRVPAREKPTTAGKRHAA